VAAPPLDRRARHDPAAVAAERFDRRYAALDALDNSFQDATGDPKVAGRRAVYAKAVRLMQAPKLDAFDVSSEPEAARKAYGDTDFGRGCLVARRLVERGVRFVEVVLDGWDTHKDNFERVKGLASTLDPAVAALLDDLGARHLLRSTLVACMGDFGRTPKINGKRRPRPLAAGMDRGACGRRRSRGNRVGSDRRGGRKARRASHDGPGLDRHDGHGRGARPYLHCDYTGRPPDLDQRRRTRAARRAASGLTRRDRGDGPVGARPLRASYRSFVLGYARSNGRVQEASAQRPQRP
jgi:hypothetical protein